MHKKNVAVIGCGLWGRNIVRNFYNLNALHTVCDIDDENLNTIRQDYKGVNVTKDFADVLKNDEIEAVAVITPSHTHYKIVKAVLDAGKHVYVEKPISTVAQEAKDLTEMADSKGLVLMVGHLLLYHPAVNRLKSLVKEGTLGEIKYVQSDRLNINYFKNDRSVMWDLAPHDLSMINYILGEEPDKVLSAVGQSAEDNDIFDITHISISYPSGVVAHIENSWIHPQKRVHLMIRGTKSTAVFDDSATEDKLLLFDNTTPGQSSVKLALDYLEIEPLKLECQHFLACVKNKVKARSDGENGYNVVKILQDAEKMMLGDRVKKLDEINYAYSRRKK